MNKDTYNKRKLYKEIKSNVSFYKGILIQNKVF